ASEARAISFLEKNWRRCKPATAISASPSRLAILEARRGPARSEGSAKPYSPSAYPMLLDGERMFAVRHPCWKRSSGCCSDLARTQRKSKPRRSERSRAIQGQIEGERPQAPVP